LQHVADRDRITLGVGFDHRIPGGSFFVAVELPDPQPDERDHEDDPGQ
jgi:hypothetical protein